MNKSLITLTIATMALSNAVSTNASTDSGPMASRQNQSELIAQLSQVGDTTAVRTTITTILTEASSSHDAYIKVMDLAETYLYDPDAPMLNEEYYDLFLVEALRSNILSDAEKSRYLFQHNEIAKNRCGSKGADFTYIDTTGKAGSLYSFGGASAMKLVMFYEPDCDHCAQVIDRLRSDSRIKPLISAGRLSILAVYPDGDLSEWESARAKFPQEWTNGYSPNGVLSEEDTYSIRKTPTLYLLSPDDMVIAKEMTLSQLEDWISALSAE